MTRASLGRPSRRRACAALAIALSVAGCGSTVQVGGGVASAPGAAGGVDAGQGLAVPPGSAAGASAPATGGAPVAAAGAAGATTRAVGGGGAPTSGGPATATTAAGAPASGRATTTGPGARTSGGTAGGAAREVVGPGITASTVYVGYTYSSQAKQADAALGASAGATPSYSGKDVYDSVIRWANAHGGFHGRHLEGIGYDINLTGDISQQEQAACDTWTKDHKVFAMVGAADILRSCAEKAHAVAVQGFNGTADTFRRFPHFVDPSAIRLDREGPVTVGGLQKAGYFTGKFGFVTWDDPSYRYAYEHGYVPAFQRAGVTETDHAFINVPQTVNALSDTTASVSSAITKFRSEGIDHVVMQDGPAGVFSGAGLVFEWMNQAKSQQYFPRYGENALDSPGYSALPPDEENNLLAVSEADYQPENDAGYHSNPARDLCFKIEADAGLPVSSSNTNDEGIAAQVCDFVFFLQKVMNSLGSQLTNDAFVQAVSSLGTSFQSPFVYGTRFPAGVRDGADVVRTETYLSSCQCLKYLTAPYQPD